MLTATSRRFVCSSTTHPVADVGEDADVGVEGVGGDQGEAVGLLPVYQHSLHTAQSGGGMVDSFLEL